MSDWYTDEVKAALEIAPVEWASNSDPKTRLRMSGEGGVLWLEINALSEGSADEDDWRELDGYDDFEAQSLIEKALREWLEAKAKEMGVGLSIEWRVGQVVFYFGGKDVWRDNAYLPALAAAVLAVHKEEKP